MDNCYTNIGAIKAKEIDGELYISCWNFSKALNEKEREISDLCKEIDNLEKQISELESELAVKEEEIWKNEQLIDSQRGLISTQRETIAMLQKKSPLDVKKTVKNMGFPKEFCCGEPLPFSDEEYEESVIEELEDRHQQDCVTINQLQTTIDTLVDRYAKLREMRGL